MWLSRIVVSGAFLLYAQYVHSADEALGRAIALSLDSHFAPEDEEAQLAIALAASVQTTSTFDAGRPSRPMDGRGFRTEDVLSSAVSRWEDKAQSDGAADGGLKPISSPRNPPSVEELRSLRLRRFPPDGSL